MIQSYRPTLRFHISVSNANVFTEEHSRPEASLGFKVSPGQGLTIHINQADGGDQPSILDANQLVLSNLSQLYLVSIGSRHYWNFDVSEPCSC